MDLGGVALFVWWGRYFSSFCSVFKDPGAAIYLSNHSDLMFRNFLRASVQKYLFKKIPIEYFVFPNKVHEKASCFERNHFGQTKSLATAVNGENQTHPSPEVRHLLAQLSLVGKKNASTALALKCF